MAMECTGVLERMSVPGAVAMAVTVGEHERDSRRGAPNMPVVAVPVSVARPESSVVARAMPVRVPAMVRVAGRMHDVRRVGMCDGEKRKDGPEREPRGAIAALVPCVVPASCFRHARNGDQDEHGERRETHRPPSPAQSPGRAVSRVRVVHLTFPAFPSLHSGPLRAGVKPQSGGGQVPVRAARHQPRRAPGKRPTTSTLRALTLMTSRSGFATVRDGSPGSSKYMSLTMRR